MIPWVLFTRLALTLSVGALCCWVATQRLAARGDWLPALPVSLGIWQVIDVPIDGDTLAQLGRPRTLGREFRNPLDERVFAQIIATAGFDAYQLPNMFTQGYQETATRQLSVLGPGRKVLAQILKQGPTETRVLMYTWVQNDTGAVSLEGALPGIQRSFSRRLALGLHSVLNQERSCVIRLYTLVAPTDVQGAQARRNMDEIAIALYRAALPGKQTGR